MTAGKNLLLAVVAAALTLGVVWYSHHQPLPREATWPDVVAEARQGGYGLLTTAELAGLYRQHPQDLFIVDTRQEWEYRTGHIQGAQNFPMEPTWWGRLRSRSRLAAFLGPDRQRRLVFY